MVVDIFIGHLVWGTTLPVIVRNLAPSIAKRLDLGCSAPLACSRGTPDARRQTSEDHRLSGRPPALPPRAIRRKLSISSRISTFVHVEKRRQRAVGLYFAANVEPGRFGTSKRQTPNRRSAPVRLVVGLTSLPRRLLRRLVQWDRQWRRLAGLGTPGWERRQRKHPMMPACEPIGGPSHCRLLRHDDTGRREEPALAAKDDAAPGGALRGKTTSRRVADSVPGRRTGRRTRRYRCSWRMATQTQPPACIRVTSSSSSVAQVVAVGRACGAPHLRWPSFHGDEGKSRNLRRYPGAETPGHKNDQGVPPKIWAENCVAAPKQGNRGRQGSGRSDAAGFFFLRRPHFLL